MATSNKSSNKIQLPNGCFVPEFKLSPKNPTNTDKDWIICYDFCDPEYPKPFRRQIRGMNHEKNFTDRKKAVKTLIDAEIEYLQSGFNPFKKEIIAPVNFEVNPNTPFIAALKIAYTKIKAVKGTLIDIKAVIKGVELSAKQLGIHNYPVKNVSRKYFKMIFEKCRENNERFSAARQNRYRAYLMKLYNELIEMEAVEVNPLRDIRKEKVTKNTRVTLTVEQRKQINEHLYENHYTLWRCVQIFFASGAREIEIMRVQKKHVNLGEQSCLYLVKKGQEERWVDRPITDSVLYLWEEILSESENDEDFLFSKFLKPGPVKIREDQLLRRWRKYVKIELGISVELYTLRHMNATEISSRLDKLYNPSEDVKELTGHKTTAMLVKIYDTKNKERKDNKIKTIGGTF